MNIYASRPDATHMSKSSKTPTYSAALYMYTGSEAERFAGQGGPGQSGPSEERCRRRRSRRKMVQTANGRRSCILRTEGVRWHKTKEVKAAARAGLKVECG